MNRHRMITLLQIGSFYSRPAPVIDMCRRVMLVVCLAQLFTGCSLNLEYKQLVAGQDAKLSVSGTSNGKYLQKLFNEDDFYAVGMEYEDIAPGMFVIWNRIDGSGMVLHPVLLKDHNSIKTRGLANKKSDSTVWKNQIFGVLAIKQGTQYETVFYDHWR